MMDSACGNYFLRELESWQQTSTLNAFHRRFAALRTLVLDFYPWIWEAYFVSHFITGLKYDIKVYVLQHQPLAMIDAFEVACVHKYSLRAATYPTKLIVHNDEGGSISGTATLVDLVDTGIVFKENAVVDATPKVVNDDDISSAVRGASIVADIVLHDALHCDKVYVSNDVILFSTDVGKVTDTESVVVANVIKQNGVTLHDSASVVGLDNGFLSGESSPISVETFDSIGRRALVLRDKDLVVITVDSHVIQLGNEDNIMPVLSLIDEIDVLSVHKLGILFQLLLHTINNLLPIHVTAMAVDNSYSTVTHHRYVYKVEHSSDKVVLHVVMDWNGGMAGKEATKKTTSHVLLFLVHESIGQRKAVSFLIIFSSGDFIYTLCSLLGFTKQSRYGYMFWQGRTLSGGPILYSST